MTVDYYALLTKAVSGKGPVARDKLYQEAYGLITRSDRKSTRLNSSHRSLSRMPSSA